MDNIQELAEAIHQRTCNRNHSLATCDCHWENDPVTKRWFTDHARRIVNKIVSMGRLSTEQAVLTAIAVYKTN